MQILILEPFYYRNCSEVSWFYSSTSIGLFNPRTRAHIVCRKSWSADRKFYLKIPHFWVKFVSLKDKYSLLWQEITSFGRKFIFLWNFLSQEGISCQKQGLTSCLASWQHSLDVNYFLVKCLIYGPQIVGIVNIFVFGIVNNYYWFIVTKVVSILVKMAAWFFTLPATFLSV